MIDKDALYRALNEGLLNERYKRFESNLSKNLPYIAEYGGVRRLVPRFEGNHVIVIGAGPSLDRNSALLKKYQSRQEIVYVATDMALKALQSRGISPAFVFSCETVPVDYFGGVDTSPMHLVAFSCMSNATIRRWKGDMSFYNWIIKGPEFARLWEKAGKDLGFIATGNIVTTQAIAFALGCNVKSLLLVGNDLGFADRFYARGTEPSLRTSLVHNRLNPIESVEFHTVMRRREYEIRRGMDRYFTNNQFLAAKLWLEELFQKKRMTVYDCSEPGCGEAFVQRIELKEYFSFFDRIPKKKRR